MAEYVGCYHLLAERLLVDRPRTSRAMPGGSVLVLDQSDGVGLFSFAPDGAVTFFRIASTPMPEAGLRAALRSGDRVVYTEVSPRGLSGGLWWLGDAPQIDLADADYVWPDEQPATDAGAAVARLRALIATSFDPFERILAPPIRRPATSTSIAPGIGRSGAHALFWAAAASRTTPSCSARWTACDRSSTDDP